MSPPKSWSNYNETRRDIVSKRFFRTTVTVEVISRGPYVFSDLADLHQDITSGPCSGSTSVEIEELSAAEAAEALIEQGSDPTFLLEEHELGCGNEVDEDGAPPPVTESDENV